MSNYNEACTEVSIILSYLDKDEYSKIPLDVIEAIEENKNKEYDFKYDENIDLKQQKLLVETKAILFNLFRDYLSTPEQKENIIKMQREERQKLEEKKMLKYNVNDIFKKDVQNEEENENKGFNKENTALIEIKKENFIIRIINKIKNFFKRK